MEYTVAYGAVEVSHAYCPRLGINMKVKNVWRRIIVLVVFRASMVYGVEYIW